MSIIIGIDHGYYAIKTAHCSFPAGLTSYGEHEPYTRQGLLEFGGCFFVCGSGRQPIQRDKTINDNYYLLTLAAIAKEIRQRGLPPECSVRIAAGLPLTSFGRDKPRFRDYLLRSNQPVNYKFEGVEYSITIEEVAIFPQGYAALMTETGLLQDEPSMLLMDLGGWTVDLMRIDNAIPAADTAHSLELGMIRCVDDIREQVRRETGLSLTDAQIENMLAGQPCTVSDVPGLLSHDGGRTFATILNTLDRLGYGVEWQCLNSKDFGVPQSRNRVYIVGYLDERCRGKVFPFTETTGGSLIQTHGGHQGERVYSPEGLSCTLASTPGGFGGKTGLYEVGVPIKCATKTGYQMAQGGDSIDLSYATVNSRRGRVGKQIAHTLTTGCRQGTLNFIALNPAPKVTEVARCVNARVGNGIRTHRGESSGILCEGRIRRLTPRECLRLQGWADDRIDKILVVSSERQAYRQAGNGVTVNVVEAIGKRLAAIDAELCGG